MREANGIYILAGAGWWFTCICDDKQVLCMLSLHMVRPWTYGETVPAFPLTVMLFRGHQFTEPHVHSSVEQVLPNVTPAYNLPI